jgi:FKBP-type peptidyl-prolyl cis-trans isomerase
LTRQHQIFLRQQSVGWQLFFFTLSVTVSFKIMRVLVSLAILVAAARAFSPATTTTTTTPQQQYVSNTALHAMDRRQVVIGGMSAASFAALLSITPAAALAEELPNGVVYTIDKKGTGPAPDRGELAAIRFKASTEDGKVIDDIFETPEPYYTRVGLGGMLPGVEGALPYMKLGDRWTLTIPVRILQMYM